MAQGRDKYDVGVFRINNDSANMACIFQSDIFPGLAAIQGFVHAIAIRNIAANAGFSRTGIDDVVVRLCNCNAAYRCDVLFVENGMPVSARVG